MATPTSSVPPDSDIVYHPSLDSSHLFQQSTTFEQFKQQIGERPTDLFEHLKLLTQAFTASRERNETLVQQGSDIKNQLHLAQQTLASTDRAYKAKEEAYELLKEKVYTLESQGRGEAPALRERLSEKYVTPEPFSGDRADFPRFRSQVLLKMSTNHDRYPTQASKVQFTQGLLKGNAYYQIYDHIQKDGTADFKTLNEMLDYLEKMMGDPDKKNNAQRALRQLRQKNRSFADYHAEFQRVARETGFNDDSKRSALMEGLSQELSQVLSYQANPPDSLPELIQLLQKLDNNLATLQAKTRSTPARATKYTPNPTAPRSPAPTTVIQSPNPFANDPIDLNNSRSRQTRGPLTPEEKPRRYLNGLCMYCGEKGHKAAICPNRKGTQTFGNTHLREIMGTSSFDVESNAGSVDSKNTVAGLLKNV